MKWIFLLLMTVAVPALSAWLRSNPSKAPWVWAAMGFAPFVIYPWHLSVAPVSWAFWPGYVKGMEVSVLDAAAIAVYLSLPKTTGGAHFKFVFLAYVAAAALSILQSNVAMASFFYLWQLLRIYFLFIVVAKVCEDERGPRALLTGMAIGLTVQVGYALADRFSGALQTGGAFGHQNYLGLISHFVAFPAFALLLAGKKGFAPIAGPLGGLAVAILTASRATLGLAGAGYIVVLVLSMVRHVTGRKTAIAGLGLLVLLVATPLGLASLDRRFESAPLSQTYDERAAFQEAARMIISDNPMGVGSNEYVVVANTGGYSDRAGVIWNAGSRSANVHNVYLLVLAETGYLGLLTFLMLLLWPIAMASRYAWKNKGSERGDLLLGLTVGAVIVGIHSFYEWVLVTYAAQALLAVNFAMMSGLIRQTQRSRRPAEDPKAPRTIAPTVASLDGVRLPQLR